MYNFSLVCPCNRDNHLYVVSMIHGFIFIFISSCSLYYITSSNENNYLGLSYNSLVSITCMFFIVGSIFVLFSLIRIKNFNQINNMYEPI